MQLSFGLWLDFVYLSLYCSGCTCFWYWVFNLWFQLIVWILIIELNVFNFSDYYTVSYLFGFWAFCRLVFTSGNFHDCSYMSLSTKFFSDYVWGNLPTRLFLLNFIINYQILAPQIWRITIINILIPSWRISWHSSNAIPWIKYWGQEIKKRGLEINTLVGGPNFDNSISLLGIRADTV